METLNNIVHYASFIVSWGLVLLAIWGIYGFFPKKTDRGNSGPAWLILAIWLGFLGNGFNAVYWRGIGDLVLVHYPEWWLAYAKFGNSYGDLVWKGLAAISIYLHFFARWKSIPETKRRDWSPLLMGFYPDDKHWAYRAMVFWRRKSRKQQEENN